MHERVELAGDRLAEIDVPTLVVHGRDDYVPPRVGEALARGIPASRLTIMEKSAHLPMLDEPEAYLALLDGFLGEIESARGPG